MTYSPGRSNGEFSPRHASRSHRHEKGVLWFGRTRRNAGRTLLFHNHVKAVLVREWTPNFVDFEGNILHSASVRSFNEAKTARQS
ncbi:hypothetical protein AB4039_04600 [Streptomyces sp. M-16]|uniref:hypothetical protein n=1 Tax=Streptomyces sp. M-16 TaxID=3233040 RepID=UPI003F99757F